MKQELRYHLPPLLVIFLFTLIIWILNHVRFVDFVALFLGLSLGSFFLDIDHLIYWFYLHPDREESQQAKGYLLSKDYRSLIKLLETTHKNHTSLIFHHFSFQVVLALISAFVFTSSNSIFGKSFLLSLNLHLLIDELVDFTTNRTHLQNWLFARESKQLSINSLGYYLAFFLLIILFFFFLLVRSGHL